MNYEKSELNFMSEYECNVECIFKKNDIPIQ